MGEGYWEAVIKEEGEEGEKRGGGGEAYKGGGEPHSCRADGTSNGSSHFPWPRRCSQTTSES